MSNYSFHKGRQKRRYSKLKKAIGLARYCITQATQRDTTQQINTLYIVVFCMYLGLAIELKSLKRPHFVSLEGWFY